MDEQRTVWHCRIDENQTMMVFTSAEIRQRRVPLKLIAYIKTVGILATTQLKLREALPKNTLRSLALNLKSEAMLRLGSSEEPQKREAMNPIGNGAV